MLESIATLSHLRTSTLNLLDGDNAESTYRGEVQLCETFLPFSELRRASFRQSAAATRVNALQPYLRYRFVGVQEGFLDRYRRHDHRVTAGLRCRPIPYVAERTCTEDDVPNPPKILP